MEKSSDIEIKSLSKRYVGRHVNALIGVDLFIAEGSFVAVLGPSGCGKSTLLNMLAGIDSPSEGSIELGGLDLSSLSDDRLTELRRTKLGFVFQFFNLLPTFTVEENVRLPLELCGLSADKIKVSVQALLEEVGLTKRAQYLPSQLSGGEMQRTALARAIIHKPRIVLADEPTGNLDTENGTMVLELLKSINEDHGITIIMATHSQEAASYAGRVISMRDGRIESDE